MAVKEFSFDISAELDMQELKNAIEQTKKEIVNRFDFKDILKEIDFNEKEKNITILSTGEKRVEAIFDVLQSKAIKRNISLKSLKLDKFESASGGNTKGTIKIIDAIDKDSAKKIVQKIKDLKLKVQASINGDIVRVSGKDKDELQKVIQTIKNEEFELALNFINFR